MPGAELQPLAADGAVEDVRVVHGRESEVARGCNGLAKQLVAQHTDFGVAVACERSTADGSSSSSDVAGIPSDVDSSVPGLDLQFAPAFPVHLGACMAPLPLGQQRRRFRSLHILSVPANGW